MAPLPPPHARRETCAYCGSRFKPQPGGSGVVLSAEFDVESPPGWQAVTGAHTSRIVPGVPPELHVAFPEGSNASVWVVLRSTGLFDDVDVSVNIRHLGGTPSGGIELRASDSGAYAAMLIADGRLTLTHYTKPDEAPMRAIALLSPPVVCPSFHKAPGASNELRAIAQGERLRLMVNGVLVSSLRHPAERVGRIKLSASARGAAGRVAFSSVVVRAE